MTRNSTIESKDNPNLKLIRKLRQKKYRYKEGKFIIESRKLIQEAIENGIEFDFILLRNDISDSFEGVETKFVDEEIFSSVSEMVSPDGYLAVVKFPSLKIEESDSVLLLDGLSDPGNLGTIIRSAEAFGFNTIYLLNTVDPFNEKTLRASMGSIFRIKLEFTSLDFIPNIKSKYKFYIADMDGENYRSEDFVSKICLVIGNEANGVSERVRSLADEIVSIPMKGKLESLNAAISASLLMSEISHRKDSH